MMMNMTKRLSRKYSLIFTFQHFSCEIENNHLFSFATIVAYIDIFEEVRKSP